MKIIHFSDTHLGFSDLNKADSSGVNQREADFYQAFADAILSTKSEHVIHTGDLIFSDML